MKIIFALLTLASLTAAAEKVLPILEEGAAAPVFMLPSLDGERVSLRDYCGELRNAWKNKVKSIVILSFMASYCVPCRHEIPQLEAWAKSAGTDVKVVFVSIDSTGEEAMRPFRESMKIENTVLLDRYGQVMKKYGVKLLPSLFIVDKEGMVRFQNLNGLPAEMDLKTVLTQAVESIRNRKNSDLPVPAAAPNLTPQKKVQLLKSLLTKNDTAALASETSMSPEEVESLKKEAYQVLAKHWQLE